VPVPIYIAGAGPMISKYAGSTAEGFICTSGKDQSLYTETLLPNVEAGLKSAGRAPEAIDRMIEVKVSFDPDLQRAMNDTRNWAALSLTAEEKLSVEDPLEMERLADALPLGRAAQRWIVSSDPDEHVGRIKTYVDLGFRHLVFHAPGKDQSRFIRLYAEHVLPRLRALP
jgi:coenzyme F420-dependent glucose-6-phosphate dehydrogenase